MREFVRQLGKCITPRLTPSSICSGDQSIIPCLIHLAYVRWSFRNLYVPSASSFLLSSRSSVKATFRTIILHLSRLPILLFGLPPSVSPALSILQALICLLGIRPSAIKAFDLNQWLYSLSSALRTLKRAASWVSMNVSSPTSSWASTGKQPQMFKGNMYWGFNLYLRRYSDVVAPSSQHDRLQIYLLFLLTILVMAAETCDDVFPFSDCSVANYSLLKSMWRSLFQTVPNCLLLSPACSYLEYAPPRSFSFSWFLCACWMPPRFLVIKLIHVVIGEQGGATHESTIRSWRMGNGDDYMGIDVTQIQSAVLFWAYHRAFSFDKQISYYWT